LLILKEENLLPYITALSKKKVAEYEMSLYPDKEVTELELW
jgi:hypothetical protein